MTRARIAGALCLIGAALVLIACLGHRWATVEENGARDDIGLLDARGCPADDLDRADDARRHRGTYEPEDWRDHSGAGGCGNDDHGTTIATRIEGKQFARAGQAGFVLAVLLAVLAAMSATRRVRNRVRAIVTIGGALAAAALGAFAILEPYTLAAGPWHPGPAWWLALGGLALAIGGAQLDEPARARIPWAALAVLAAAVPLVATARGTAWWSVTRPPTVVIAVGPALVEGCDGDACSSSRFGELIAEPGRRADTAAIASGRLVAIGAGVAAVLAAALAIALALRQRARLLAWLTLGAAALTGAATAAFALQVSAATLEPHVLGEVGLGAGLPIAIAGVLTCIAGAALALRGPTLSEVIAKFEPALEPPVMAASTLVGGAMTLVNRAPPARNAEAMIAAPAIATAEMSATAPVAGTVVTIDASVASPIASPPIESIAAPTTAAIAAIAPIAAPTTAAIAPIVAPIASIPARPAPIVAPPAPIAAPIASIAAPPAPVVAPTAAPRVGTPAPMPVPRAATPAPIPVVAPPCPSCRTPMLWVSKRSVWLCVSCRRGGAA
jgi:hypothetical protein